MQKLFKYPNNQDRVKISSAFQINFFFSGLEIPLAFPLLRKILFRFRKRALSEDLFCDAVKQPSAHPLLLI